MSWLPLYNSWMIFTALVSVFLWELVGVGMFLFIVILALLFVSKEVLSSEGRFFFAFWLFMLSEVAAFGSLLTVCVWSGTPELGRVSDCLELPLLGCFLLMGSSFTMSAYHSLVGTFSGLVTLLMTMVLGLGFVGLQVWEFNDCECDLLNSFYHSACFCTVGLHFSHVVVGLVGLVVVLMAGHRTISLYYANMIVWYWHFVDYIWMFVFTIVYAA